VSWPQYAAYAVGFLTIGIMWLNRHPMLAQAARVDRVMLVINNLFEHLPDPVAAGQDTGQEDTGQEDAGQQRPRAAREPPCRRRPLHPLLPAALPFDRP
jgi:hypothetical protein